MEHRSDDLSNDEELPVPGTDESGDGSDAGAKKGPGNVSVDEPTAAALESDAGTPGGEGSDAAGEEDEGEDDTSEGTSEEDESG